MSGAPPPATSARATSAAPMRTSWSPSRRPPRSAAPPGSLLLLLLLRQHLLRAQGLLLLLQREHGRALELLGCRKVEVELARHDDHLAGRAGGDDLTRRHGVKAAHHHGAAVRIDARRLARAGLGEAAVAAHARRVFFQNVKSLAQTAAREILRTFSF